MTTHEETYAEILRIARDSKSIAEIIVPAYKVPRVFGDLNVGTQWRGSPMALYHSAAWAMDLRIYVEKPNRIRFEFASADGELVGTCIMTPEIPWPPAADNG